MFYPARTAISRKVPSVPAKHFVVDGPITDDKPTASVLDWGCGKGVDVDWFADIMSLDARGYDPYFRPRVTWKTRRVRTFDYVTCFYVLNIIPTKKGRVEVIKQAAHHLANDGKMFIAVRHKRAIDHFGKNWQKYRDGYRTRKDTFQRGFTDEELEKLVKSAGMCYTFWSKAGFIGATVRHRG